MHALLAEYLEQQLARTVCDGGLFGEVGCAGHEHEHGQHARDSVESAEICFQQGKCVQRARACRCLSLCCVDLGSQASRVQQLTIYAGELAACAGPVAVAHHRHERVRWPVWTGHLDASC